MKRALAFAVISAWSAVACTLLSPLDYLTAGGPVVDGGPDDGASDASPLPPPQLLASGQATPDYLAVDATNVYWHTGGSGSSIVAVAKTGGMPRTVAGAAAVIEQIAADADPNGLVYWTDGVNLRRAPKQGGDGGSAIALVGEYPINGFALDMSGIFTSELDENQGLGAVARASPDGGGRFVLNAQDQPSAIGVGTANVYWVESANQEVHALAKNATGDAGAPQVIGTNDAVDPAEQQAFAVDEQAVYWSDPTTVSRHNLTPNGAATILYEDDDASTNLGDVSLDATYVWFTEETSGTILRVPRSGGAVEIRATGQTGIVGLVSDGANVYFVRQGTGSDGQILRIPAQ
ncbi:MAG TPA: hypothetical protein VIF62_16320 [Labilithrix sp.]|jgi:hypothetical protein